MGQNKPRGDGAMRQLEINDSLLGVGLYSAADASRIVSQALKARVTATNLRRWSEGRKTLKRDYASVIGARYRVAGSDLFTFAQLVELLTIAFLRHEGFSLGKIRHAYERGRDLFGDHPFATREYSIHGDGIFERRRNYEGVMEDLTSGRLAFERILKPLLRHIVTYEDNESKELNPLGKERSVILNPSWSYGSPVNRDTGIQTSILYAMWKSENSFEVVANWYRVPVSGVQDAVEYETALLEAA